MQLPPAAVTSQWPPPNYVDPEVRGPALLVIGVLLSLLAVSVVGLRVLTRLTISKFFGIDDILIVLAVLPSIGHTVLVILTDLQFGGNRHIWDVPTQDITMSRKLNLAVTLQFAAACTLTKLSMIFFTKRILSNISRIYKLIITGTIIFITVQAIMFFFIFIFQCSPVNQYWTFTETSNCIDETAYLLAASILNTITDVVAVLMPIPTIWDLQMPKRQRIGVISLFGVGVFVCSAGIARTIYTYKFTTTWDKTWESCPVWISSSIELDLGIICASVPALKPLYGRYLRNGSDFSSSRGDTSISRHQPIRESFSLKQFGGRPTTIVISRTDISDSESQRGIISNSSSNL